MATYWRVNLPGERPLDEVQATVGRGGGILLRVHVEDGETQVYYTGDPSASPDLARGIEGAEATEVALDEVTKIG